MTDSDVTVCVATYGGREWQELAESRAVPSAVGQAPVIRVHGDSLHGARNLALTRVETPWVIFLDADDQLEDGYVAAMLNGTADIRAPAVRYVRGRRHHAPARVPRVAGHRHDCTAACLPEGNFVCVGAMVRTGLLRAVGGFEPWEVYEDWAAFLRMWHAGATVEAIPAAVYRAYVRRDSRNRAPAMADKNRVHAEIVSAVLGADGRAAAA